MNEADDKIPRSFVYTFPAIIDSWHDGDTCTVHRGARPGEVIHGEKVRVQGINAPELHDAGGVESRRYAEDLLPSGTLVTLTATKEDKYSRFLARITMPSGGDFSEHMIVAGYAQPYMT